MNTKVINLDEYKQNKVRKQQVNYKMTNNIKQLDEDDRKVTFNLFMQVLKTMKSESY